MQAEGMDDIMGTHYGDAMSLIDFMPRRWYDMHELNILIKSGGGTGPVKPGNRRKLGATSSGA